MSTKRQIKYWLLILFLSLVPTYIIHLLIKPLWKGGIDNTTLATTLDSIITMLLLPLYLSLLNFMMAKKHNIKYPFFIINIILVLYCIWLSAYFHFDNWASSIGDKVNPDNATLEVIGLTKFVGYIISFVSLSVGFLYLRKYQKIV